MDMSPVGSIVGTTASMIYNDSQTRAERRRQEKLDAYNREITERNYHQQQVLNSPSFQKQALKDAGYNPAVSGDTPTPVASSPSSNVPQTIIPNNSVGSDIVAGASSMADKLSANADRDLREKELLLQKQKNDLDLMRINQERVLTRMRELVNLFNNGKGALSKDDLNRQLHELAMFISNDGLDVPLITSQINTNNSVVGLNESNVKVNNSVIAKNNAEVKKIDAETRGKQIENLFAPAYYQFRNKKVEWDGYNAQRTFEKLGAETDSIKLDNYKKSAENFSATLTVALSSISPGAPLPAELQENIVDYVIENYPSIFGLMVQDIKENTIPKRKGKHSNSSTSQLRDKLKDLQKMTDKANRGKLEQDDLWYLKSLLGTGRDAVTIPLRK